MARRRIRNRRGKMRRRGYTVVKASPDAAANHMLLDLAASRKLSGMALDKVGEIVTRMHPGADRHTIREISLAWTSTDPAEQARLAGKENDDINYALVSSGQATGEVIGIIMRTSQSEVIRGMAAQLEQAPGSELGEVITSGGNFEKLMALGNPNARADAVLPEISNPDANVQTAMELRFRSLFRRAERKKQ